MVRRLPAREESRIASPPVQVGAQTCTRLWAFREIQGDLPSDKRGERFSATGRRGRFAENTAKREDFRTSTSYFSDNNDLLAEKSGFELSIQLYTVNPRLVPKLQMARALRENVSSEA